MPPITITRTTRETDILLTLDLHGSGQTAIDTGIGFFDHMLELFAHHGLFDLTVQAKGDLHVDEHHTVEDVGICLGKAISQGLGDRSGIVRAAHAFVPMDEALARVVIDLGGRPYAVFQAQWRTPRIGGLGTDLIGHFFESVAIHAGMNLHARVEYGRNDHHQCEALFKAFARALDAATRQDPRRAGVPSTKGTLTS
ncbi:MAG TPA: imidazoleglycerol-phosphate dehydratase HisB [Anaerolineae bacterium]|nr:imidazoleglycerol-phosphate dehydratase HisB [Caldilineae bacterium]HID35177.1 imidazoleglycerol-phosphate dehydratase HisB [Anaerolineae bacterium]HIQ11829.1 imidazoleglycerol-phosphate dehydratase HisB [Caldilineales bacterium]